MFLFLYPVLFTCYDARVATL